MDYTDIKKFISDKGYRDLTEIKSHFSSEDQEILYSSLSFLVSKGQLKKVRYITNEPGEPKELYIIPA
jgi:hypothetical protein